MKTLLLYILGICLIGIILLFISSFPSKDSSFILIETTKNVLNLDTIKVNQKIKVHFNIKNTETSPFLIVGVQTTCECTKASWSKSPIKPGESGNITIYFEPNSLGNFVKEIKWFTNVDHTQRYLKMKGFIKEE